MLGRTHITTGVAAALIALHPTSVLGIGAAVAGGALGGAVCDIDCKGSDLNKETARGAVMAVLCIAAAVGYDLYTGSRLIDQIRGAVGTNLLLGGIGILVFCILGVASPHRTFTHSLLGALLMSASVWLISEPLGMAVLAGMASHILLDLLNRRSIPLLYPLKKPAVCFGLCDADGIVDRLLSVLSSAVCVILLFVTAVPADVQDDLLRWLRSAWNG